MTCLACCSLLTRGVSTGALIKFVCDTTYTANSCSVIKISQKLYSMKYIHIHIEVKLMWPLKSGENLYLRFGLGNEKLKQLLHIAFVKWLAWQFNG